MTDIIDQIQHLRKILCLILYLQLGRVVASFEQKHYSFETGRRTSVVGSDIMHKFQVA